MEKREKLSLFKRAIEQWGVHPQVRMVFEECSELMNALAKTYRCRATKEDVITELADVAILVEQMAVVFGYEEYEKEIERKLEKFKQKLEETKCNLLNQEDNFKKVLENGNNNQ